ncbi:MAG: hypothetical protein EPO68_05505, partial [Planctomycetota bacterium]
MHSILRSCGRVAAFLLLFVVGGASAQNTPDNRRELNNGADVYYIYGDPTIGASVGSGQIDTSGDLWWLVHPRGSMIAASGTAEVGGVQFELYDTDWSTPALIYDVLFGPGAHADPNDPNLITPDFSSAGMAASLLLLGGSSGFPNPCTASPGFCTSIGGTSICVLPPAVVGWIVSLRFSNCDGTGIVLTANNTVDNVVTAFLPGGMTFSSGPPGACGMGDYSLMTLASTNETQADSGTPGASRYGGFQIGAAPGFNADGVDERSIYPLEFCDSQVNTMWNGDRGTVGLHVDATLGAALKQTVHDAAGVGAANLCFVSNCVLAPFPAPGVPIFGGSVMLNLADPTVTATLKKGVVAPPPFFGQSVFTPAAAIPLTTALAFD